MLEPISPQEAVNYYLRDRADEIAHETHRKHDDRLKQFVAWCDETNRTNLNELTGRDLLTFKEWRSEGIKQITLKNNLWTVKKFLRFCENIDAVPPGISEKVLIPKTDPEQEARDVYVTKEEANAILDFLKKYEYASLRHALFITLWKTGIRSGTLRGLDLDDFKPKIPALEIKHRSTSGTPLKNKKRGEREIHLTDETARVLTDYIEHTRSDVTDDYNRRPLFTGRTTRAGKTVIQRNIYTATRPCFYTGECPHDRDLQECEANSYSGASKCPSSKSPHTLRRGYITAALNAGQPVDVTAERTNVSRDVLDRNYDARTNSEKRQIRRQFLEEI
ncbi:tyrosine-type recombinase/integrase [Haladaptatus salinisoli]|uniref:tyrosine-type recombinase/integrase n=1 Tax=Haladaptatus salinisoli TaxID=2884876 RepID=UPI001D0BC8EC|nr:site-specific integrase [Haladaptatus salinisoli]